MVIFGGFYKLANELNDLHIFDFDELRWLSLYEQPLCPSLLAAQDLQSQSETYNGGGALHQ